MHFAVKFSSASALENLTAKCTSCNFISSQTKSNQVGLSPISSQPRLATLDSANLRLDLGRLGWTLSSVVLFIESGDDCDKFGDDVTSLKML